MKSLKGQLLVAAPQLLDPNFFQSVLLMIQHDDDGAVGLVLNRPLELTLDAAWKQFSEEPCHRTDLLHLGGPCHSTVMMALHNFPEASDGQILPGVHFASDAEHLRLLVASDATARFFVGCAGWSPGQLEGEMDSGAWSATPATAPLVFINDPDECTRIRKQIAREALFASLKLDPKIIPDDPSRN